MSESVGDAFEVVTYSPASPANRSRRGAAVELIVVQSDPRSLSVALQAFVAADAPRAPHYYVGADARIFGLVAEQRMALHSGIATWESRRKNIDRISIGVILEHTPGAPLPQAQFHALYWLVTDLRLRYGLADDALLSWFDDPETAGERAGILLPLVLPLAEPAPPPIPGKQPGLLGAEDDEDVSFAAPVGETAQAALFSFLQGEAFRQRGEGFKPERAFHLQAAVRSLGAPLARDAGKAGQVSAGGKSYGWQVFGADTLFNEIPKWGEVQRLSELLNASMPERGLGRALLEASFAASGAPLFAGWATHLFAVKQRLGTPLGASYDITVGAEKYRLQVFSADTIYTPLANPVEKTNWGVVLRLSETAAGPLADALWSETYKLGQASYDPNSSFHKVAQAARLGTPLTKVYTTSFANTEYQVQVFALDTLYATSDGMVLRVSELAKGLSAPDLVPAKEPAAAVTPVKAPAGAGPEWPPRPGFNPLPTTAARQQLFGKFEFVAAPLPNNAENIKVLGNWQQENIVPVNIPQLASVKGGPRNGVVLFHKLGRQQLIDLFAAWEAAGLMSLVLSWAGTYVPRFIRGSTTELSNHAFGTAFDINVPWNGLGAVPALLGQQGCLRELVPIANQLGFYWGGHFSRLDGMHFEIATLR